MHSLINLRTSLLLLITLCFTSRVLASDLQSYEAVYHTKLKGFTVSILRSFQVQGSELILSTDAKKLFFSRHEKSISTLSYGISVTPSNYVYVRKGFGQRRNRQLVFNREDATVVDLMKPEQAPLSLPEHTHDKLSFQIQMRIDLMNSPCRELLEYTATDGKRLIYYSFHRLGTEILDTPMGKFLTIKFRQERPDKDTEVFLWVAPDLDYLLIQTDEIKKPGDKPQRLLLQELSMNGKALEPPAAPLTDFSVTSK